MTEIAFLLLAHKNPEGVAAQARLLASQGDAVAIHYDGNAPAADFARLRAAVAGQPRIAIAPRVRCGWGEWSLVAATLAMARTALRAFPRASHFYMVSGDCLPIKPRAHIAACLAASGHDYIEHHDFFESDWIRTGLKEERLVYRHYVNERARKALFYRMLEVQKRLGLRRALPQGLRILIGSQWWVLRRATLERVLGLIAERPDIVRFFRRTWIPDETFFQTLVLHVTPRAEVENRTLTFLAFSDYGMPLVLHDDHAGLLEAEEQFFARKIAPGAAALRARLASLWAAPAEAAGSGGRAHALYRYLTGRGREGLRHAQRVWDRQASIGVGRTLDVIVCKKWHIGKRLALHAAAAGVPAYGYVFDEEEAGLPPLGNLERGREKRGRHRRAFLRVLFDATGTDRLAICLDPAQAVALADLAADACRVRVLFVRIHADEAWLAGHAGRMGLLGGSAAASAALIATLGRDVAAEERRILGMGLNELVIVGEECDAAAVGAFLGLTPPPAAGIMGAEAPSG
jgi:hypothetical protein